MGVLGRHDTHMGESRLEPARDRGYKYSSMFCPKFRNLLARLLAFALDVALQLPSASVAAEPQLAPPVHGETDSAELPARLPPISEYDASIDGPEELPLDLKLDSDEEAAKPRRSSRGGMGGPMGSGGPPLGYRAFGEPTAGVEAQPASFEHWGQEATVTFPAWTDEPHLMLVSTSFVNDLYDTAAVFPRNGQEFPESLWNIRLGMNYFRELQSDWKMGTGVSLGSASDRPFAALRDVNPTMFAFLSIPSRAQNSWNLSVFYSPISEIPFPIPGIAYYWYSSEALQMNIGLPAQVTWQPTERFTVTASYMILHTITARGNWQLDENWSTYLAYENRNRAWFLNDRERDDERLFSYNQALLAGLQRTFFDKFLAELTAGYMFNRFYFISEDYSDRNLNRIDIDSGLTVSAQIGVVF